MAAHPSVLQSLEYAAESSFGETTTSVTARLPVVGRVDTSGLNQPKVPIAISKQRMNEEYQDIRGPMGGSLSLSFMLPGMGSTCAGAVPSSDIATFLGLIVGNVASAASAGTTLTGGTANIPTTTASGTFSAGALARIGAFGDARGGGQTHAIATHSTTNLTLLTNLGGSPTNGDVLYTGKMVYPTESPTTAGDVTGTRLVVRTANQQYICHGCYPTAFSLSDLGPGQQPKFGVTFGVAWWETASGTFPVSTSMQTHSGMTVSGGSLFYNAVGTATRATRDVRTFEMNVQMETVPLMGPGGVNAFQHIIGARRTAQSVSVSWTEDAEVAGTNTIETLWNTDENSITNRHALYSFNTRDGASAAVYFPNLKPVGDRPVQMEMNGLNCVKWNWKALTGTTTTNDLTLSSWRMLLS